MEIVYYLYQSRDGHYYIYCENLTPYLMTSDYLLFDSKDLCLEYWKAQGIEVVEYEML